MNKRSFIVLFAVYLLAIHPFGEVNGQGNQLKRLEEFHKRGGLPNVFEKIRTSRQVSIAYLGGSVTAAENGWRELTFDWFRLNFPQTAFYQINAAIGGTGSELGVFRIRKDVLEFKPDLIFVEFAVNDARQPRQKILQTMEGIIRKCWKDNPFIDLCFVYIVNENSCKDLVRGEIHNSVLAMEELADYYDIPSIHVGIEVARLFTENKLILTGKPEDNKNTIVFTRDHVHPLAESGHPIYASVVAKYLDKMQKKKTSFRHDLPQPYAEDNWEGAKMLDLSSSEKIGDWEKLHSEHEFIKKFSKFIPEIYKGTPGSTLKFRFRVRYLALYDIIGPGTGVINVNIDGKEQKIERFDGYCTYYRLGNTVLADRLDSGEHEVEITVLDEKLDKEKMIKDDRIDEYYANPDMFMETNWYPGYFLVIE